MKSINYFKTIKILQIFSGFKKSICFFKILTYNLIYAKPRLSMSFFARLKNIYIYIYWVIVTLVLYILILVIFFMHNILNRHRKGTRKLILNVIICNIVLTITAMLTYMRLFWQLVQQNSTFASPHEKINSPQQN